MLVGKNRALFSNASSAIYASPLLDVPNQVPAPDSQTPVLTEHEKLELIRFQPLAL